MSEPANIIEAEEIRIVDKEGHICIRLGLSGSEAKTPGINVLRTDGSIALTLGLATEIARGQPVEYPVITLYDEDGLARLSLNVAQYPGLSLIGSEGKPGVTLVVPPDDDYGEISLADGEGGPGWNARGFDNDASRLNKLEYKINHLFAELGMTFKPLSPGVQDLIAQGKKYEAIKLYREESGVDLKSAKDAIEFLADQ